MGKKQSYTKLTKDDVKDALTYVDKHWPKLTRKKAPENTTLIPVPNPYVVPSSGDGSFRFDEQYYWDTYFTALGIDNEKLVCGMLDNLIYLFNMFEMIPNGNRYYFTSRSQPPILTSLIFHIYEKYKKPKSWLRKNIAVAKKEYAEVWMSDEHPQMHKVHKELSRYYDINCLHDLAEVESGWDMTTRFKRQCLDYLPIDLNCLLYKYEKDFEAAAKILNAPMESGIWAYAAKQRRKTIHQLMWHTRKGFFFDYNYQKDSLSGVWSLAAYFALWSGVATQEQAGQLVQNLHRFERPGGLTATTEHLLHSDIFGSSKTQWAYPNAWAPLEYIVIEGLEKYGYKQEATRAAHVWLKTCNDWFITHGEFLEKYNAGHPGLKPMDGLYKTQTGYGWTNSVFAYLARKYAV